MKQANSKKYKILVLMATYNGEKYVTEQILSIHHQIGCDISILISDDNSVDDTLKKINELKNNYKINLNVITNKTNNRSSSGNFYNLFLNANIENYDFIALSDQDDIFEKNKFYESIMIMNKQNVSGLSSSVQCFNGSDKILKQSNKITKYDYLCEGAGQGCTFVISATKFAKFQNFCKQNIKLISDFYYHDWLLYIFFRANKFNWFFYDQCLTKYRIHRDNNSGSKYTYRGILFRLKKIFSGWYLKQIINAVKIYNNLQNNNIIKINFINLFYIIVFHGRRKFLDRLLSFFSLLTYPFLQI